MFQADCVDSINLKDGVWLRCSSRRNKGEFVGTGLPGALWNRQGKRMFLIRSAIFVLLILFMSFAPAKAFELQPINRAFDTASNLATNLMAPQTHYELGFKKFFNSFTSYQFPNPFPPGQDPLSRLEFPIDQWFFGGRFSYNAPHWSAYYDTYSNINRDANLWMQDSDWEDEQIPFQKTVFSESKCRLNSSWLIDLGINLHPDWAVFREVSPVTGFRYQYFYFTTHDGYQVGLDGHSVDLPGDGIDFKQTFYQWYIGGLFSTNVNTSGVWRQIPQANLKLQADYALSRAKNEDLHLLRRGERITRDNTDGHCWHFNAAMAVDMRRNMKAKLDVDFKRIITHGDHELSNSFYNVYFSFTGAKVWSDLFSLTGLLEFTF